MKKPVFIIIVILLFQGCSNFMRPPQQASPEIRVLLSEGARFTVLPNRTFLFVFEHYRLLGDGKLDVEYIPNGIRVNGVSMYIKTLDIIPYYAFRMNDRSYRGSLRVANIGTRLQLINLIDIESYLQSVVPSEMPAEWEIEALKAQAVVARTYALFEILSSRVQQREFDVYADTRSQVYQGFESESEWSSRAVRETSGTVVTYEGKPIHAFFHANSGGITESCEEAFGTKAEYLTSVQSPYCMVDANLRWKMKVPLKDLETKLANRLTTYIRAVNVLERNASGRISRLEVVDFNDNRVEMTGTEFRAMVGVGKMKSVRANIRILDNISLLIYGVGFGHGVGMGQWDALGMAKDGYRYGEIVKYFYRNTQLNRYW